MAVVFEIVEETMNHCARCPYKTASESAMHTHILAKQCPAGSASYHVRGRYQEPAVAA